MSAHVTTSAHIRPRSFDILCVIKDTVDPVNDEKLAVFVVGSHAVSGRIAACGAAAFGDQWVACWLCNGQAGRQACGLGAATPPSC